VDDGRKYQGRKKPLDLPKLSLGVAVEAGKQTGGHPAARQVQEAMLNAGTQDATSAHRSAGSRRPGFLAVFGTIVYASPGIEARKTLIPASQYTTH